MSDCVDRVSMKSETLYNNAKHRGEKECINVHEDPVTFLSFVKVICEGNGEGVQPSSFLHFRHIICIWGTH